MAAELQLAVNDLNVLCGKAEGRDKLARLFQYGSRAIVGAISFYTPKAGTTLHSFEAKARSVMVQLAIARRTHRWCKEIPVIQTIPKAIRMKDPIDRVFEVLQKSTLVTFMVIDHVALLKQWKVLKGKQTGVGTVQLGLKWFCYSNIIGFFYQLKKLYCVEGKEDEKKAVERRSLVINAAKFAMLAIQMAHLSLVYQSHDLLVGLLGIVTSSMDVSNQLPERKPEIKIHPDAKSQAK
jgi:hypothetical protein